MNRHPIYTQTNLWTTGFVRLRRWPILVVIVSITVCILISVYYFDTRKQPTDEKVLETVPALSAQTRWYTHKPNAIPGYGEEISANHSELEDSVLATEEFTEPAHTWSEDNTTPSLPTASLASAELAHTAPLTKKPQPMQHTLVSEKVKFDPMAQASPLLREVLPELSQQSDTQKNFLLQHFASATETVNADLPHISAGTLIPAVLATGLNSDLPGFALAQVRLPVYDHQGENILIPQGSKLLLHYDNQVHMGQERVLVAVTQLILPNGQKLKLAAHAVIDESGFSGFHDQSFTHQPSAYAAAAALGIISAGIQLSQPQANSMFGAPTAGQTASSAMAQQFGEVANKSIQKHLDIQPTLRIRPGYLFNVLVTEDVTVQT